MEHNKKQHSYPLLYVAILLVVGVVVYGYTFDSKVALLGDNASYYALGKSIQQGDGYTNIMKITRTANNHYPPGYPFIIALLLFVADSFVMIKLLNGLFLLGGLWLIFDLVYRVTNKKQLALVVALFTAMNSHVLYYSSIMMSEIPFMFFSLLSVWAFVKAQHTSGYKYLIVALLSAVAAYHIRSLGIALLAGFSLHYLLNKNWKYLFAGIGAFVVLILPWFLRSQAVGKSSYINQLTLINPYQPALGRAELSDYVERLGTNFSRYITIEIPSLVFPGIDANYQAASTAGDWFWGIVILGLCIYGVIQLKQYLWVVLGYLLGTYAVLLIWPDVWIGVRFSVPVAPFLYLALFSALAIILNRLANYAGRKEVPALFLLVLLLFSFKPIGTLHAQASEKYPSAWKNYFDAAQWIRRNAGDDAVVSCGKPNLFYLYADTYTMRYKFTPDTDELLKDLEENKVDYVVIDQVYGNTLRYLLPAAREHPDRFELVLHLKNPDTFVLRFKKD